MQIGWRASLLWVVLVPSGVVVACAGSDGGASASGGSAGDVGSGGKTSTGGDGGQGGAGGAACPVTSGAGTTAPATIDGQETWTAAQSPYVVEAPLTITGELTIEECVAVLVAPGVRIDVQGKLTTRGRAVASDTDEPIVFPVLFMPEETDSTWGGIDVEPSGLLDLEVTGLVGGGDSGPVIHARGEDQYGLPHQNVRMLGSGVYYAADVGIQLETRAGFTDDSVDVVVDTAGSQEVPYPISVEAGALSSLPAQLSLQNNAHDEIFVETFRQVHSDTIKNLGYPYFIHGQIRIAHENGVTKDEPSQITIEPGVTLRMVDHAGSGILIGAGAGYEGILVAEGTPEEPIRFESGYETQAPGDWLGLYFRAPTILGNSLKYVEVAHAGAPSGAEGFGCGPKENDASILILSEEPVTPFLEDCSIEFAGGDTQILLGWTNEPDQAGVASQVASANRLDPTGPSCHVSYPQGPGPACPSATSEPTCL